MPARDHAANANRILGGQVCSDRGAGRATGRSACRGRLARPHNLGMRNPGSRCLARVSVIAACEMRRRFARLRCWPFAGSAGANCVNVVTSAHSRVAAISRAGKHNPRRPMRLVPLVVSDRVQSSCSQHRRRHPRVDTPTGIHCSGTAIILPPSRLPSVMRLHRSSPHGSSAPRGTQVKAALTRPIAKFEPSGYFLERRLRLSQSSSASPLAPPTLHRSIICPAQSLAPEHSPPGQLPPGSPPSASPTRWSR